MTKSSVFIFILILILQTTAAFSAVILVDTTADDNTINGNCTLREAIQAANQNTEIDECNSGDSGPDSIIIFVHGTLTMTSNQFIVTERVTIGGPGPENLTIVGTDRIFAVDMAVATHDFELIAVTLTGGDPGNNNGGAVYLQNVDKATFTNVHFVANTAENGGAIGVGDLLPDHDQNEIRIQQCVFRNNSAILYGGALGISEKSNGAARSIAIQITESAFIGNSAGDLGGAVSILQTSWPDTVISSSLFVGNSSDSSGALFLRQPGADGVPSTIENCTFAGNSSPNGPGAIYAFATELRIVNSTFHLNGTNLSSHGAHLSVYRSTGDFLEVGHTIFGETTNGVGCNSNATSLGYNISGDDSCLIAGTADLINTSAKLGGIEAAVNNKTVVMPGPGSAAIDSGDPAGCLAADGSPLLVDQRNLSRPADGDGDNQASCDRGAAEVQPGYAGLFLDGFEVGTIDAWSSSAS